MGLSENLAGVTLLAFGNGSPDIFAALADYTGDTELLYAELFGSPPCIITLITNYYVQNIKERPPLLLASWGLRYSY